MWLPMMLTLRSLPIMFLLDLTAMFVKDCWENKTYIMRELRAILSGHSLAVDDQRKVVKRTISEGVVCKGGQSFTICGDFGVICGVYVVPDTSLP